MRGAWLFVSACVLAALTPLTIPEPRISLPELHFPGWPEEFEGKPLVALPLSEVELRFEREYPGRFGRFTDGRREILIRWIAERTRKLHPSAECYKAQGYVVQDQPVHIDSAGVRWGCYTAVKGEHKIHIRERIYDAAGQSWTDVSAWYWAALGGQTQGPWWAVSAAEPTSDLEPSASDLEIEKLLAGTDLAQPLWLSARMNDNYRQVPFFAPFDRITLGGTIQNDSLDLKLAAVGKDAKAVADGVEQVKQMLAEGVKELRGELKRMPPPMRPMAKNFVEFLSGITLHAVGKQAVGQASFKDISSLGMMMPMMFMGRRNIHETNEVNAPPMNP